MMAVGCIQAQECHTGHCPTGVASYDGWLMRGLDPKVKSHKLVNNLVTLRKELTQLLGRACGYSHPAKVTLSEIELLAFLRYRPRAIARLLRPSERFRARGVRLP